MTRFKVFISDRVELEITEQVVRIATDSIDNALKWEARLREEIAMLSRVHGLAVDEDASERVGYEVRSFAFEGTYVIHFRVNRDAKTVRVVNFRHGARLPHHGEP